MAIGSKRLVEINNFLDFLFSFFPEELEENSSRLVFFFDYSKVVFVFVFVGVSVIENTESLVVRCVRALPLGTVDLFLSLF
jgi:hypothetical protein